MPLIKLSREQLLRTGRRVRGANPEYVAFLRSRAPGEGGKAIVADEGVSRQSVKNRLNAAAKVVGVSLKYHRSGPEEVVFEVVQGDTAPRRGRKPQSVVEPGP